jgi:hypothetical protein
MRILHKVENKFQFCLLNANVFNHKIIGKVSSMAFGVYDPKLRNMAASIKLIINEIHELF